MELNILNMLLLLGIVQGTIIIVVFLTKTDDKKLSNKLFAGIVFILTLATIGNFLDYSIDSSSFATIQVLLFYYLPFYLIMLLGPVTFFYCKSLFDKNFKLNKFHKIQFLPVLVDTSLFIISMVVLLLFNISIITSNTVFYLIEILNDWNSYLDLLRFFSFSIYLFYSWKYLLKVQKAADKRTFQWCRNLLIGLTAIVFVWMPFLIIYLSSRQIELLDTVYYFPIYYPIVLLIYFLSIKLMTKHTSFRSNQLSNSEILKNVSLLNSTIENEKLYKDSNLNLDLLSETSGIPQKTISFILNHQIKKGFNDYINEYRIKAALFKLKDNELDKLTLEGIAFEVGFSSRSTFNRAFKKTTGQLPSEFLKKS